MGSCSSLISIDVLTTIAVVCFSCFFGLLYIRATVLANNCNFSEVTFVQFSRAGKILNLSVMFQNPYSTIAPNLRLANLQQTVISPITFLFA